jgi:hypothetical protein
MLAGCLIFCKLLLWWSSLAAGFSAFGRLFNHPRSRSLEVDVGFGHYFGPVILDGTGLMAQA